MAAEEVGQAKFETVFAGHPPAQGQYLYFEVLCGTSSGHDVAKEVGKVHFHLFLLVWYV